MSEFEPRLSKEPNYLDELKKFEQIGVDPTDKTSVAEYTRSANDVIADELANGLIDIHKDHSVVELAFRNISVFIDRVVADTDIKNLSDEQCNKLGSLDSSAKMYLLSCNKEVSEMGGLSSLQRAIYNGGELPDTDRSNKIISELLKDSTDVFAKIISDPNVDVSDSILGYFAGNTTGVANQILH